MIVRSHFSMTLARHAILSRWVRKRQGRHRGVYVVANKTEGHLTEQMVQALEDCRRLGGGGGRSRGKNKVEDLYRVRGKPTNIL